MQYSIDFKQDADGRWTASIPDLAGVTSCGADRAEAQTKVQTLALNVLAERLEQSGAMSELLSVSFQAEKEFDLGVLLVHGIGSQRSGETLVRWGDVLLKTIRRATGNKVVTT